jgi:hypothetical protein
MRFLPVVIFHGLVLLAACGGPKIATQLATEVSVTTKPAQAVVPSGGSQEFAAQVTGSAFTDVTWSVQEGSPGGLVTVGGVYTAPVSTGTFHVVATSAADPTKSGSSTVTVTVGVSVSPLTAAADVCGTASFTATVVGTTNTAVTWSVLEGTSGGIVSAGAYTAPSTPGTYHVVATSQADPTQSASAAVTVSQHILSVTVSPSTVDLTAGTSQVFTAKVTNTCGTFTATQALTAAQLQGRVPVTAVAR